MKKLITTATILTTALTLVPQTYATTLNICPQGSGGTSFGNLCGTAGAQDITKLIGTAINFIFVLAVVIALFYLIWGGVKWLMSQGDKSAVDGARQHIIAALVGLIIIFLSYFILNFVLSFFGINSLTNIVFPHL